MIRAPRIIQCPQCGGIGSIRNPPVEGAYIRRGREAAGISLRELARRLGISPGHMCHIEKGRRGMSDALYTKIQREIRVEV